MSRWFGEHALVPLLQPHLGLEQLLLHRPPVGGGRHGRRIGQPAHVHVGGRGGDVLGCGRLQDCRRSCENCNVLDS